MGSVLVFFV